MLLPAGSQWRCWGYGLPGPRRKWELLGISPRVLISFYSLWDRAEGCAGAIGGCAGESWNATAELHLGRGRSRRRGGGGADWGGLSCHIPQGESSWAPCPYLGRRCLLTWVCGMPRQDASSSPGGWGRLSTVGAKSGAKSANFGIEDPSRPRHLRVQQVQSLRRQSALSANKTVITICGRPSVPAHKLQGALILTAGWVAMLLDG